MNIVNAKDVVFKFNGKVLGCVKSMNFKITQDTDEVTCGGSGNWKEFTQGFLNWTGGVNSVYREFTPAEEAANVSFDDLFDIIVDGSQLVQVEFAKKSGSGTRYHGNAIMNELSYDAPEKGAVTWSANFIGSGGFVKTV